MEDYKQWFAEQVIFLTGGTGSLGGCILYKLALQLPTKKIFVLGRGSVPEIIAKLDDIMPGQVDDILDTQKVHILIGDVTMPDLGLKSNELEDIRRETTVMIHAAASISLSEELSSAVRNNCLPTIALEAMLHDFPRLKVFLHVSTAYVNSHLPNGVVEERVYPIADDEPDPQTQLSSILSTGQSPYTDRFVAPYALAKHLGERLIIDTPHPYRMLVVRPALIGPAILQPYPFYGPSGAMPVQFVTHELIAHSDSGALELHNQLPGDLVLDEIPVDLVANVCLLHLARGSSGIVHASSELYAPWTIDELAHLVRSNTPEDLRSQVVRAHSQASVNAHVLQAIVRSAVRPLIFDCSRSACLRTITGPLGLSLEGHDKRAFLEKRVKRSIVSLSEQFRGA